MSFGKRQLITAILAGVFVGNFLSCAGQETTVHEDESAIVPESPIEKSHALSLQLNETTPTDCTLQLHYSTPTLQARVMEAYLQTHGIKLVENSPGQAATQSQKQLIVQDKGNGLYRLILYSAGNTAFIPSGNLTTLVFEREDNQAQGRIDILTEQQIFAPMQANEGLNISDPMVIDFGEETP